MTNYKVIPTPNFERELKHLSHKYVSIKNDVAKVISTLKTKPDTGTSLGKGIHKIRLAITSKNKGKSGGGRIITYFISEDLTVLLLSIYDKSERDTLSDKEIRELLSNI